MLIALRIVIVLQILINVVARWTNFEVFIILQTLSQKHFLFIHCFEMILSLVISSEVIFDIFSFKKNSSLVYFEIIMFYQLRNNGSKMSWHVGFILNVTIVTLALEYMLSVVINCGEGVSFMMTMDRK